MCHLRDYCNDRISEVKDCSIVCKEWQPNHTQKDLACPASKRLKKIVRLFDMINVMSQLNAMQVARVQQCIWSPVS